MCAAHPKNVGWQVPMSFWQRPVLLLFAATAIVGCQRIPARGGARPSLKPSPSSPLAVEIKTSSREYRSWDDVEIETVIVNNTSEEVSLYLGNGYPTIQYVAFSLLLDHQVNGIAKRHFRRNGWRKAHPVTIVVKGNDRSDPIILRLQASRGERLVAGEYTCHVVFMRGENATSDPIQSNKIVFGVTEDMDIRRDGRYGADHPTPARSGLVTIDRHLSGGMLH